LDKVGIALAAVIGGIIFVIAMLGFVALATYLTVIGAVVLLAGLIVLGLVRLCQVRARLVVLYTGACTVWLVAALWSMLSGQFLSAFLGLIIGSAIGGIYYLRFSQKYAEVAADPANLLEYQDEDGKTHKYILVGAKQLPPQLQDRPVVLALGMLAIFVAVLVILVTVRFYYDLRVDQWISEWVWAVAFGLLGGFSALCTYTCIKAEMDTEVEIFNQSIPDEASSSALGWMERICPAPFKLLGEAFSGIREACRHVRAVSFRWS